MMSMTSKQQQHDVVIDLGSCLLFVVFSFKFRFYCNFFSDLNKKDFLIQNVLH